MLLLSDGPARSQLLSFIVHPTHQLESLSIFYGGRERTFKTFHPLKNGPPPPPPTKKVDGFFVQLN